MNCIKNHANNTKETPSLCHTSRFHHKLFHNKTKNREDHPELTGGITATSAPDPIILPASLSTSTYSPSRLSPQLHRTRSWIPGCRSSSTGKSRASGRGAGSRSVCLPVYWDAVAK